MHGSGYEAAGGPVNRIDRGGVGETDRVPSEVPESVLRCQTGDGFFEGHHEVSGPVDFNGRCLPPLIPVAPIDLPRQRCEAIDGCNGFIERDRERVLGEVEGCRFDRGFSFQ